MIQSVKANVTVFPSHLEVKTVDIIKSIIAKRECVPVLIYISNIIDPMFPMEADFVWEEFLTGTKKVELIKMIHDEIISVPPNFAKSKKSIIVNFISSRMKRTSRNCGIKEHTANAMYNCAIHMDFHNKWIGVNNGWQMFHERGVAGCRKKVMML
jgi:hypothetical protein